jgi:hypothetical protein
MHVTGSIVYSWRDSPQLLWNRLRNAESVTLRITPIADN